MINNAGIKQTQAHENAYVQAGKPVCCKLAVLVLYTARQSS